MNAVAIKTNMERDRIKQLRNFCFVALLIFSNVYFKGFVIAAALVSLYLLMNHDLEYGLELLFFQLPMASVFKITSGQSALFSYLLLFFIVKAALETGKYSGTIIGILLMIGYLLAGGSYTSFMRCKDILLCLLVCYFVMTGNIHLDYERTLSFFAVGVIISALGAIIADNTPIFSGLVHTVSLMEVDGEELTRFRALYGNSNYYTFDISMLCAGYMCVFCKKRTLSKEQWMTFAILLFFGVMSSSFSFMISTVFVILMPLLYLSRQNFGTMIRTLFGFAVVIAVVYFFLGESTKTLIAYRVETQLLHSEDLSSMTTGRIDLQSLYIQYFRENIKTVLFGEGLGAPNIGYLGRGPHNTYIDIIYFFGALGGLIYIGTLIGFIRVRVRFTALKIYQLIPTAIFLARLMAISMLLMNNMTFYYLLIWLSYTFIEDQGKRKSAALNF